MKLSGLTAEIMLLVAGTLVGGCRRDQQGHRAPTPIPSAPASAAETAALTLRDADILEAVRSQLEHDGGVSMAGVQVGFDSGVVELIGSTSNLLSKERERSQPARRRAPGAS